MSGLLTGSSKRCYPPNKSGGKGKKDMWFEIVLIYLTIGLLFEVYDYLTSIEHRPSVLIVMNLFMWPVALCGLVVGLLDKDRE